MIPNTKQKSKIPILIAITTLPRKIRNGELHVCPLLRIYLYFRAVSVQKFKECELSYTKGVSISFNLIEFLL
jgi:hypothetical protein